MRESNLSGLLGSLERYNRIYSGIFYLDGCRQLTFPHSPIIYGNRVETYRPYSYYYMRAIEYFSILPFKHAFSTIVNKKLRTIPLLLNSIVRVYCLFQDIFYWFVVKIQGPYFIVKHHLMYLY
jgi:hypothetical protein